MKRQTTLTHEFVEYIPDDLKPGTVYVCIQFATVVHKCCCGCGSEVVTPLSPTDWKLIFDGQSISLDPSIGSWSLSCQSHYWIRCNKVVWARRWSRQEIEEGRAYDRQAKEEYFSSNGTVRVDGVFGDAKATTEKPKESLWRKLTKRFKQR